MLPLLIRGLVTMICSICKHLMSCTHRIYALFYMNVICVKQFTKKSKEAIYISSVSNFWGNINSIQSNTCIILNITFEVKTKKGVVQLWCGFLPLLPAMILNILKTINCNYPVAGSLGIQSKRADILNMKGNVPCKVNTFFMEVLLKAHFSHPLFPALLSSFHLSTHSFILQMLRSYHVPGLC